MVATMASPKIKYPNQLRRLRKAKGLTLQDVADEIGVAKITVSQYERGIDPIPEHRVFQLAELYNVSPLHIFVYQPHVS